MSQTCVLKTTASFALSSLEGGHDHETVVKDTTPMEETTRTNISAFLP